MDLRHSHLQNPLDHRLTPGNYSYQGVHGYSRLFDHLHTHQYPWLSVKDYEITAEVLEGYDILFINLLHKDDPEFTAQEISDIQQFVADGGGLMVIADHSNVYRHAERLNPLLEPMGVKVRFLTAIDSAEGTVAGSAWLQIRELSSHPTNQGVSMISFQTGGVVESSSPTATLTDLGYGDFWDEKNEAGHYGNWVHDGDLSVEPKGPGIGLVAAVEYGKGRVVVVGDQNIYGDVWLHFGDNFRHALNSFEWLAQKEGGPEPLSQSTPTGLQVTFLQPQGSWPAARSGADDFYGLFHHFNRDPRVTARAHDTLTGKESWVVWAAASGTLGSTQLVQMEQHLERGENLLLMLRENQLSSQVVAQLKRWTQDSFQLQLADTSVSFNSSPQQILEKLSQASVNYLQGHQELTFADELSAACRAQLSTKEISELKVAILEDAESKELRLPEIKSSWGKPVLRTSQGVDILRTGAAGKGRVLVLFQDRLFANRNLGDNEAAAPKEEVRDSAQLLYYLVDYLAATIDSCP